MERASHNNHEPHHRHDNPEHSLEEEQDPLPAAQVSNTISPKQGIDIRQATPATILYLQRTIGNKAVVQMIEQARNQDAVLQRSALESGKLNVVGEDHEESNPRRSQEKWFAHRKAGLDRYWKEQEFKERNYSFFKDSITDRRRPADSYHLRLKHLKERVAFASRKISPSDIPNQLPPNFVVRIKQARDAVRLLQASMQVWANADLSSDNFRDMDPEFQNQCIAELPGANTLLANIVNILNAIALKGIPLNQKRAQIIEELENYNLEYELEFKYSTNKDELTEDPKTSNQVRSERMHEVASRRSDQEGVWKIGNSHVKDIDELIDEGDIPYNLTSKDEFNSEFQQWLAKGGDREWDEPDTSSSKIDSYSPDFLG